MGIVLFLIKADFWTYNTYLENPKEIKVYKFKSLEESLKVGNFFLNSGVNDYCKTLVAPYDVDFFNVEQCTLLKEWIKNNRQLIIEAELVDIFELIEEYCTEAIKLGTGIEIEC